MAIPRMASWSRAQWWSLAAGVAVGLGLTRPGRRFSLEGRVVLVTGGSRGLGLVLGRELIAQKAKVALLARDPFILEQARRELAQDGAEVMALTCDVGDQAQVQRAVDAVLRRFGRIDAAINNAGVIEVGPLETMTHEDFDEALRAHFWGPLHVSLAVAPGMKARGEGRIVNICSIGGRVAVPHLVPYSASKFALAGLSEGLASELSRYGIRVTTVFPGLMRTGSPRNATFKGQHRAEYAWFKLSSSLPLLTIDCEHAARRILLALRRGERSLVLTLPAKLAVLAHGIAPGVVTSALAFADRLLPEPGGIGTARARGFESESRASTSWVSRLTDVAAHANNEVHAD